MLGGLDWLASRVASRPRGVAMENVSGRPRFSGGSLPRDLSLISGGGGGGATDAGTGGAGFALGGLRDRCAFAPPGGGGGGWLDDDATDTSGSGLRRASASCARDTASFSVNIPISTPVRFAASINSFVLTAGIGTGCGTAYGCGT